MKVKLISKTPNSIKVVFTAIRTCYSPYGSDYIWNEDYEKYVSKNNDHIRLIKQIQSHGHLSTFEHVVFNFSIEGVSRTLLAQLTRHRVGFSYSVQSQRYVSMAEGSKHGGFDYVIPQKIAGDEKLLKLYKDYMENTQELYNRLKENKVKSEDARMILPNAATTNLILSVNLRAFLDFYKKRGSGTHAQSEIQELAETMRKVIEESEPWTKELF